MARWPACSKLARKPTTARTLRKRFTGGSRIVLSEYSGPGGFDEARRLTVDGINAASYDTLTEARAELMHLCGVPIAVISK
jgi:hypothetical protein